MHTKEILDDINEKLINTSINIYWIHFLKMGCEFAPQEIMELFKTSVRIEILLTKSKNK